MSGEPTYLPGGQVSALAAGQPLPEPWYIDEARSLTCDLCRDAVEAVWPLSAHRPPDLGSGPDAPGDGELVHLPALCRSRPPCPETRQPTAKEAGAMTPTFRGIATPADRQNEDRAAAAARHLFEAELALHDAHQSHVQAWIAAAGDKLHQAVLDHLAATGEQHQPDSSGI